MGQILQEVDRHQVEVRQVDAHVHGKEVVNLPLRVVFGCEELCRDWITSCLLNLSVLSWLVVHIKMVFC